MVKKEILVLIDTVESYDRSLLKGIIKYAKTNPGWILVREPPEYRNITSKDKSNPLPSINPAGIIASEYKLSETLMKLEAHKIIAPYKAILKDYPNILTNDVAIGEMAANYFLSRGYENFAFYGYPDSFWSIRRLRSFRSSLRKSGYDCYCRYKSPEKTAKNYHKSINDLAKWMLSIPKPFCMFICSDDLSLDLMEAVRMASLVIPDDVAVLGVDNDDLICDLCTPALSSIEHDPFTVGYEAAKLLDDLIQKKVSTKRNIVGEPHYVVSRQSTDIHAVKEAILLKAISFILENAPTKNISVRDVVSVTALSRRQLERKFITHLRSSIRKKIQETKINNIKLLLYSTNLTVKEIAAESGFNNMDNFSRYFKTLTGFTPTNYRKKKIR